MTTAHPTIPDTRVNSSDEIVESACRVTPHGEPPLEYNGERMVPEANLGQVIYAEHVTRYLFASQFVSGKRVLDFGSGEGYGAEILRRHGATSVHGIDISPVAVEHARRKYQNPSIEYICGDCLKAPFKDDSFDLVTSFEVIEHLTDHAAYIDEACRILREDGILVISTPNIAHSDGTNHFHLKELSLNEFIDLLRSQFTFVRIFTQTNLISSLVYDSHNRVQTPFVTQTMEELPGQHESLYFLAVCSDKEPALLIGSTCMALIDAETPRLNRILNDTRHVVEDHIALIREKDKLIDEKDRQVESLVRERSELMPFLLQFRDVLPCIDRSLASLRNNDSISSESSLEIAQLCLAANLIDSARWFINQVLRKEPYHVTALYQMGRLYFNAGKNGLAREYLGMVLQRDNNHPEAHALLSRIDAESSCPTT